MEVFLTRSPGGALIPMNEEEAAKLAGLKTGDTLRCEVKRMRNAKFFRKWWVLAKYAYDLWSDHMPTIEYRGQRVQPNFERFRKDLIIMAGFYEPVFAADGTMKVQALSLAWGSMDEQEFEKMYSATIQAVLTKVLGGINVRMNEAQIRGHVEHVLRFD